MKIRIGNYLIDGEWGNYVVSLIKVVGEKAQKENAGNEYVSDQRFYGSLYQALNSLLNAKLAESDEVTVRELKEQINAIGKELKALADEIDKQQKENQ